MWSINEAHFRRIDLNALIVFMAVMRERSVTRAADRLLLGQPAVSHALNRLRELFDDPLFVRTRTGMEPTPRALAAFERLAPALGEIHAAVFDPPAFDPASASATLRLGVPDDLDPVLLPDLTARLAAEAPGIALVVRPADFRSIPDQLDAGDIDVAVSARPPALARGHAAETLRREGFLCLYDPRQFAHDPCADLDSYTAAAHVLVSQAGQLTGAIDRQLAELGRSRRVVMAAARFASLPDLLSRAPLVASMPATCARLYARTRGLRAAAPPFEAPDFALSLIWPERLTADPLHAWARGLLRTLVAETHGRLDAGQDD
jgi:LysR family transcriptional activator of mexEF-oprN operon